MTWKIIVRARRLDYANQRWYTSTYGRFTSPDRFKGSRWTSHPQTWNAYMYVMGDPINHRDRSRREQDCGDDDSSPCGFDCSSLPVDSFYDPSCQMEPTGGDSGEEPVDSSHPTPAPTCSLEVESFPLNTLGGYGPDLHGSLYFQNSGAAFVPSQAVAEGYMESNGLLNAAVFPAMVGPVGNIAGTGTDDGMAKGPQVCAAFAILVQDAQNINNANITYSRTGPNSNSALSYMLTSLAPLLGSSWYSIPWTLVGFNSSLPGIAPVPTAGGGPGKSSP